MTNTSTSATDAPIKWHRLPAKALIEDALVRREWDALSSENGDIPVLCSDMVCVALAAWACGKERLCVGRRGDTVVAMAVLTPTSDWHWATFQPSQVPLGALVVVAGMSVTELGASLMRSLPAPVVVLSLTQQDPIVIEREPDTPLSRSDDFVSTAWIEVTGDFESYWAERGKNLRQNLRKQRNRLAADGTVAQTRIWRQPDEMAPALARYGALESKGWKAGQGTAIEVDNHQGRFYAALFEAAARRGEAIIYEYQIDSRTVAMNLCIHRRGTLVILKTTYDESVKPLSPAFLLHEDQLQSIFASGEFQRIEYYGRVMEWHTRWTSSSRMLFHTTFYRWPLMRKFADWRRLRLAATGAASSTLPVSESAMSRVLTGSN